jgi:hypothetical protein
LVTVSIAVLAFAAMAGAQDGPIGQNYLIQPKAGQEMQWEAAYKEHLQWHIDMNDTWNWTAYQIMSGPDTGKYMIRTGGHEWKDWDAIGDKEAKDAANYMENAGKHTASYSVTFDRIHGNLSRFGESPGPYKLVQISNVSVKADKIPDFLAAVGKYHAAFEKTNSPNRYATVSIETGGRTGDFMFVGLHDGYADLEEDPMAMAKMMEEVYGRIEAEAIAEDFQESVESMHSYIMILREDLTYRAPETTSNE